MSSTESPAAISPPPARSRFVTVLAWIVIVISAVVTPISVISFIMILVGSYGTQTSDPLGFLTVVVAPPCTVVAGIGLLRRWRWSLFYMVALLPMVLAYNGYQILRGPTPEHSYMSASGVKTTVLASKANYSIPVIAICIGLLIKLLSRSVRSEFGTSRVSNPFAAFARKNWRVGHRGRDMMYYEEKRDGTWQRLEISGEMLMGRAHHVIYFDSPGRWQSYPDWARSRRDEIIARIKSEFREPDYEYHGDGQGVGTQGSPKPAPPPVDSGTATTVAKPAAAIIRPAARAVGDRVTPQQVAVVGLFVAVFIALAAGMFWLVNDGLGKGETHFPTKRATLRRLVSRQQEPAMFWVSIGLYAAIGLGSSCGALWFTREGWKAALKCRRQQLEGTGIRPSDKNSESFVSSSTPGRKLTAADLVPGKTYRVKTAFEDYDRVTHPVGETWRFLRKHFVPHDDGLSLVVESDGRERHIRLQWRKEAQAKVIDDFAEIVEEV